MFGGILFLGTWISMIISTVNGAGIPILVWTAGYLYTVTVALQAKKTGLDPAKIAGPMETAFQDVVGQSFLLGVSMLVFSQTEDRL